MCLLFSQLLGATRPDRYPLPVALPAPALRMMVTDGT